MDYPKWPFSKWTIQNGIPKIGMMMNYQILHTISKRTNMNVKCRGCFLHPTLELMSLDLTQKRGEKKTALGQLEKEQIIKRTCNLQKLSTCSTRFHTSAIFSTAERIRKIIPAHLKVKSLETMLFLGPIITQDSDPKTGIRQWLFCLRKIPWNAMEIMLQTRAVRGSQQG
jgi:hypothetical protein